MGNLWAWGGNSNGELGTNNTTATSSPVQTVSNVSNWQTVSAFGNHVAAIKNDGSLWNWGFNYFGNLGDNTVVSKSSPIQTITNGTTWSSVSIGILTTAAIKNDGTLWFWGNNNFGQIGDGTASPKSSPVQTITFGTTWDKVSSNLHTVATKTDGTLWTWGNNSYGQLGDNTTINKSSPAQTTTGGTTWDKIAAGFNHTAAIKTDGTLWCWGKNAYGQLGDDTTTNRSSPVQTVAFGTNWSKVACGYNHTAAIKTDGTLWLWGYNVDGQLGDDSQTFRSSPVQTVTFGTDWLDVKCGSSHTVATKTDFSLYGWGFNSFGQLGDNTTSRKSSPVQTIMGGNGWSIVAAGYSNTYAIFDLQPTQISIFTNPAYVYTGKVFGIQPVLQLLDGTNNLINTATNAVTVAVTSGNATISGTTTVNAVAGIVTYTNLVLTGYGPVTLQFTATGLTSASVNVNVEISGAIIPKRSETASSVPTSGQLLVGELAINITDQKGYVKKSDGTIVNVFTGLTSGVIQNYMIASGAIIPDGGTF